MKKIHSGAGNRNEFDIRTIIDIIKTALFYAREIGQRGLIFGWARFLCAEGMSMKKDEEKEFLLTIDKLQWALGESLFRAKKLQEILGKYPELSSKFDKDVKELVKTLTEISFLYRHKLADNIKAFFPKIR
jgi:hypothetical protein